MKITILDCDTNYQLLGDPSKPVAILLHGWGHTWESWSPLIGQLSKHYRLLLPDLPGFGESHLKTPALWTLERYQEWLQELVLHIKVTEVSKLLGHSFGGKVAAFFAGSRPTVPVKKLILISPAGFPDPLTIKQQVLQKVSRVIPPSFKNVVSKTVKSHILQRLNTSTDYLNSTPHQKTILKLTLRQPITKQLQNIAIPTTLIWGENDTATPLLQAQKFLQFISNAELRVIANATHFSFVEQPNRVLEIILS